MPKISTYATSIPAVNDKLIGTDANDSSATKNFTVGDVASLLITTEVLDSSSTINQVFEGSLKTILFGAATSNDEVSLASNGEVTFLKAGTYLIESSFNVGQITASSTSTLVNVNYGSFLNGTQFNGTKMYKWNIADNDVLFYNTKTDSFILKVVANDVLKFAFNSTNFQAGLGSSVASSGLEAVPSSNIKVFKIRN
tara:strand:+ start:1250 stop:1840 length:591 start_codon:yes stop_codon:yes gene_type:complete